MSSIETNEHTFDVGKAPSLYLTNIRGRVEIQAGDSDKIKVTTKKYLDSGNPEYTILQVTQDNDGTVRATVKSDENLGFFRRGRRPSKVDFTIEVPAQCSLNMKLVSSSATVSGIDGKLRLKSVSGKLTLSDLAGDIKIKSVSGKIKGDKISGDVKFDSVSGEIHLTDSDLPALSASTVSGNILLETPLGIGPYYFKSVSGNAVLIVPPNTGVDARIKSLSGRLQTTLPARSFSRHRGHQKATLNNGGPLVSLKTVSGNLRIVNDQDERGSSPQVVHQTSAERIDILSKLENGDISVEEAMTQISA